MALEKRRGTLLTTLEENPETVIWIHVLKQGNCNVYISSDKHRESAAILQLKSLLSEPTGFGLDADALWQELAKVEGWQCVLVDKEVASALGEIISNQLKTPVHFLDDIYHIPRGQVLSFESELVRRLTLDDFTLVETSPREVQPIGFWGGLRESLTKGLVAGAIIEGKVVATSFVAARGQRYADIGVYVRESYRRRGLATAAASIVARSIQSDGLIPVWGCGSHNLPSLRLARKLGFVEISRRTYVIIEKYLEEVSNRTYPIHNGREGKIVE
jgi:RimJ/RimL family protein N-acetyltransferase